MVGTRLENEQHQNKTMEELDGRHQMRPQEYRLDL